MKNLRKVDLKKKIKKLYTDDLYYISIPAVHTEYEEAYHEVAIDPDGKTRYLLEEREHSLKGIPEIIRWVDSKIGGKILDIGCGPGWFLSSLSSKWDRHGIEVSSFASNVASKYGEIHNGLLETFDEKGFDVIVMNHVIEHIADPIPTLKKIKGMLNPNGIFIIGTPDFDSAAARRYGDEFRLLDDPTHVSLFSLDSMHRCLRDIGFHIDDVEFPYFDTPWFNEENLLKMLKSEGISPPFYGSNMTFLCSVKQDNLT
tara:strand:- start:31291 stop:32061 length:771 start_codon:yes stop_codon:yes gene_type:complete